MRTRAASKQTLSILLLTVQSALVGMTAHAGTPTTELTKGAPRPTVHVQDIAFRQSGPQAVDEQQLISAQKPTPAANSRPVTASKRLTNKIVKPIRATLLELSHPFDLLRSAQRLMWPNPPTAKFDDYVASRPLGRAFDIDLNGTPTYSLTSKTPDAANERIPIYRYVMPIHNETLESSTVKNTATQLQVRMRSDWIMLYEVNRTSSTFDRDDIGVGLGLRHAF